VQIDRLLAQESWRPVSGKERYAQCAIELERILEVGEAEGSLRAGN
jgi:hypothetical protein